MKRNSFLSRTFKGPHGELSLGDIISPSDDLWENQRGEFVISISGLHKLKEFVGATWNHLPQVFDRPRVDNDHGFFVMCLCKFPNGEESWESGEATDQDSTFGSKWECAIQKGRFRAFLKSDFMSLHQLHFEKESKSYFKENVLYEESSEPFPPETITKDNIHLFLLPENDPAYPLVPVLDVWRIHKDKAYIEKLSFHPETDIRNIARWIFSHIKK